MAMGLVYSRVKDDTAVARTMFEYAIELNPSLVEAYTHYADTLAGMGMLKESLKFRKKATVLDPLSTFYRSRLVNHYSGLAAYDEAYKELEEIFKINPEDTYGLEELANIKRQQGEDAEALAAYKKVHDLRPGDAYSASNMATVFEYLDFPEKADRWLAEARLRGEDNRWEITAREELALLRKDAEELLAIADVVEPTDLAIANSLRGFYHYLKKDYATAQEFYQKVFNDPRYNSTSYYNRDHIFAYFSAFIEVMDADNEMPMADVFRRLYKEDGGTENHSVGRPSFSRHMIMACIELSAEQPEVSKEEIYVYLNRAVDNGFKKLSFFEDWPCFEGILDEPEYFTLKARIESLIEAQRLKMQELGL